MEAEKSAGGVGVDRLDVESVRRRLLGGWRQVRLASREIAARPALHKIEGLGLEEHRDRVFGQLRLLVEEGLVHRAFPKRFGGADDHGGNIAGFEELVSADPSLQIKAGVQFGLFGAAVLQLGTTPHHDRLLPDIMSLKVPGCFAMTEIGHGSDVASLETTATYDPAAGEFVLHTPFRAAWKEFIGNAARDGRAAVVFAQLVTRGENHGVHAFYVPVRDESGGFLPGISGEDDGVKGGLNGVDNGRLAFDHVRVPRENLLNRYGDVDADGVYSSPIESKGRRFFTMLGTLVQGRVSLNGAATGASAIALSIAIEYGLQRRQFAPADGEPEERLLDYQQHQRRLLPRLAQTYAATFAHDGLLTVFDRVFSDPEASDADREQLETLAAALKPLSTWHALDTIQEAREACGGAGFMAENRLTGLHSDLDVYATFEGDNTVLLQLVGKRLLGDYGRGAAAAGWRGWLGAGVARAFGRVTAASGLQGLCETLVDATGCSPVAGLHRTATQRALLAGRVEDSLAGLAAAVRPVRHEGAARIATVMGARQTELIEAARGFGEYLLWEAFTAVLDSDEWDAATRRVLVDLRDLFAFTLLESHGAWYLAHGRLSRRRFRALRSGIDGLLARLRPHAQDLVEAFGYSQDVLRATITSGVEAERRREADAVSGRGSD